jgi:hypothetical protein
MKIPRIWPPALEYRKICSFYFGEILFLSDDRSPCAVHAPLEAGAHCDALALPKLEIFP